jgi:hypothetical protein
VKKINNYTQNECRRSVTTLETSGEDVLSNLFHADDDPLLDYLNEEGQTTLGTGGKDPKLHSKREEKIQNYTRDECKKCKNYTLNEWGRLGQSIEPKYYCPVIPTVLVNGAEGIGTGKTTLETSGEDVKLHSKRVEKM